MPSDGPSDGLLAPVWAGTAAAAATSDAAWLQALVDAEAALARAQERLGLIPGGTAAALAEVAGLDPVLLAEAARGAGNPVVPLLAELRVVAEHVHEGATSQDIMDTAAMLVADRTRRLTLVYLDRALEALAGLAAEHRATPCAGRTLGRQAVPTTFGLVVAEWLLGLLESRDRLAACVLPVQFGAAAGTLAGYGPRALELCGAFAQEAGLAEPLLPWHTRRTPVTDLGAALGAVAAALGKIGTDVVLLGQSEVGELAEPAAPGRGGSSAMAHKRNPVLSIMLRSAGLQVPALVSVLLTAQAGAAYQRPAGEWHAEWPPLREALRLVGGACATAAELLEGLEVASDRMAANLKPLTETLGRMDTGHAAELTDRALAHYAKRQD